MDKTYLTNRTEYLLQKAIEEETQRLKDRIAFNTESNIEPICTEIGVLLHFQFQCPLLVTTHTMLA